MPQALAPPALCWLRHRHHNTQGDIMNILRRRLSQLFVLLLLALAGQRTALAADIRIPLPGGGALVLPAPDGWSGTQQAGPVPTLTLGPGGGKAFQVLVSPLVRSNGATAPADADSLRRLTASALQRAQGQAVEKRLQLQSLQSASVQGFFFDATDRAPEPDGYKNLTQGVAAVQGLPVSFTVLSNGQADTVRRPALAMLRGARREP
jgi:hypothetical protein